MNNRIKAIADAATVLFLRQGYAKTQISDIAKAIGVSVGTIYLDFAGKKEIMHFVLKCTIDSEFINGDFERPITDDLFMGLEHEIAAMFEDNGASLAKHLEHDGEGYSFEMLISDAYELLYRYAAGCLFIEKNQHDFKFLSERYRSYRTQFFDMMNSYLNIFIAKGDVRAVERPDLVTMLIIEMLSWWAMDMRYISFETADIPKETAKAVCLDNIMSAYRKLN